MMQTSSPNIIDLASYRLERVRAVALDWPEDWAVIDQPERVRFTLEWLPAWFALAAEVADERRLAAEAERLKRQ